MMKPERWFVEELQLISPRLYPFFWDKHKRWFIIKDYPRRFAGITDYDPITGKNFVVELIVQDPRGGYMPLSRLVLYALKLAKYQMETVSEKEEERKEDEEEEKKIADAIQYKISLQRAFLYWVNRLERTKTFVLGGNK